LPGTDTPSHIGRKHNGERADRERLRYTLPYREETTILIYFILEGTIHPPI